MIFQKMPKDEYFKLDALSSSFLKLAAISPAHTKTTRSTTKSMSLGTLVHEAILEPIEWGNRVRVDVDKKTTKEWKAAVVEYGENAIKASEYDEALAIAAAVLENEEIGHYFRGAGVNEHVLTGIDPHTGQPVKALYDRYDTDNNIIIDIKTCRAVDEQSIRRAIFDYQYHVQAAWYLDVAKWVLGVQPEKFVFVFVETSDPYCVRAFTLDEDAIDSGRAIYRRGIKNILEARQKNDFWKPPAKESVMMLHDWQLEPQEEIEACRVEFGSVVDF